MGALTWVMATRGRRGDAVGPYSVTILLLVSIFGIRPLFMLQDQSFGFYGLNIRSGFNFAAATGLLAIAGVTLGYFLASQTAKAGSVRDGHRPAPRYRVSMARGIVIGGGAVAGSLALLVGLSGGVGVLFAGRNQDTLSGLQGAPVFVSALAPAGAVLIAVVRVLAERERALTSLERFMFWVVIIISIVPSVALGNRRFLLPCLVAALIATTAQRYDRRIQTRYVAFVFAGVLLLAIIPFVRSTGARQGDGSLVDAINIYIAQEGVFGSIKPFFTSYDTEMFNYVAYVGPRMGEGLPYGFGRGTIGDLALSVLPASVSPFPLWSNEILTRIFGEGCAGGVCPVPSYVGVLSYDFGLPGVAIGSVLLGILCQKYRGAFYAAQGYRLVFVLGLAAFSTVIIRGNSINQIYIAATTCVLAMLMLRLCRTSTSMPGQLPTDQRAPRQAEARSRLAAGPT